MSLFKEKDDILLAAFKHQESDDSDECSLGGSQNKYNNPQDDDLKDTSENSKMIEDPRPNNQESTLSDSMNSESTVVDLEEGSEIRNPINKSTPMDVVEIDDDGDQIVILSSSDDEEESSLTVIQVTPPVNSPQIPDNRPINLKVIMGGQYHQFATHYDTPLIDALETLINDLKKQKKCLILSLEDNPISLQETPKTLKLHAGSILKAFDTLESTKSDMAEPAPSNQLRLKIQDGNRKHTKEFCILKTDRMLRLKESYANEFSIEDVHKIKLIFDGDVVEDEQTPEELDLDDGCVIDVMMNSINS